MSESGGDHTDRIDQFFGGPGAGVDRWRHLVELTERWSDASTTRTAFGNALAAMTALKTFTSTPAIG